MLFYILLGVIVAVGVWAWVATSDGEMVVLFVFIAAIVSGLILVVAGLIARTEVVDHTYTSPVTVMHNFSGVEGFAFVDGADIRFKTEDSVLSMPYADTRVIERGKGKGHVVIETTRNTYGWVLPWSMSGKSTAVLQVPENGLGVM